MMQRVDRYQPGPTFSPGAALLPTAVFIVAQAARIAASALQPEVHVPSLLCLSFGMIVQAIFATGIYRSLTCASRVQELFYGFATCAWTITGSIMYSLTTTPEGALHNPFAAMPRAPTCIVAYGWVFVINLPVYTKRLRSRSLSYRTACVATSVTTYVFAVIFLLFHEMDIIGGSFQLDHLKRNAVQHILAATSGLLLLSMVHDTDCRGASKPRAAPDSAYDIGSSNSSTRNSLVQCSLGPETLCAPEGFLFEAQAFEAQAEGTPREAARRSSEHGFSFDLSTHHCLTRRLEEIYGHGLGPWGLAAPWPHKPLAGAGDADQVEPAVLRSLKP